jgi:hypothetical protein
MLQKNMCVLHIAKLCTKETASYRKKLKKQGKRDSDLFFYRKDTKPLIFVVKNDKKIKKYFLGEII